MYNFQKNGVELIQSALDKNFREYILNQLHIMGKNGQLIGNNQVEEEQIIYAPAPLEALMLNIQPHIEKIVGRPILPSFSFLWIYKKGGKIKKHVDRESIDIAATLNIKSSEDTPWPLHIQNKDNVISIDTAEGDILVFDGKSNEHWRNKCTLDWRLQAQFFYVYADGSNAKNYLDYRKSLGGYPVQKVITSPVQKMELSIDTGLENSLYYNSEGEKNSPQNNPKANIFFDGKVINRDFEDITTGEKYSLGTMQKGQYKWMAEVQETFTILQGICNVDIDGEEETKTYNCGDQFTIEEGKIFSIQTTDILDYKVSYD